MGVGIVKSEGDSLNFVHADVLKVRRNAPRAERLHCLYTELLKYIAQHKPDEIAIEEPFVARNVRSAMAVGQAQAVAMIAAKASGKSLQSFAPREVKLAVTGYGNSSKEQVQEMTMVALNLNSAPVSLDASDALAIAICHINAKRVHSLISDGRA